VRAVHNAVVVGETDRTSDDVYNSLEERFGPDDPRSTGYRSVRYFEVRAEWLRKVLRRHDGWILDVACGHGLITEPLVAEGRCVFGLDSNQRAMSSASRRGLIVLRANAFSMPIKEASFDVVLSTNFINNFDPIHCMLLIREMARVTRSDGVVVLDWRHGTSLMGRLITNGLRILDLVRGEPSIRLFNHSFAMVCGWAANHQLKVVESLTVNPLLRSRLGNAESVASRVFGTSCIAVFHKFA
jgi:SAM-dependent methyltransferase